MEQSCEEGGEGMSSAGVKDDDNLGTARIGEPRLRASQWRARAGTHQTTQKPLGGACPVGGQECVRGQILSSHCT